jgi:hypothetical protein
MSYSPHFSRERNGKTLKATKRKVHTAAHQGWCDSFTRSKPRHTVAMLVVRKAYDIRATELANLEFY